MEVQVNGTHERLKQRFSMLLEWIYSASLEMPTDLHDVSALYFLAYEFKVFDLLTRCEHELINKIGATNVIDVLLVFFPH